MRNIGAATTGSVRSSRKGGLFIGKGFRCSGVQVFRYSGFQGVRFSSADDLTP
jgi:hypothetical protein